MVLIQTQLKNVKSSRKCYQDDRVDRPKTRGGGTQKLQKVFDMEGKEIPKGSKIMSIGKELKMTYQKPWWQS